MLSCYTLITTMMDTNRFVTLFGLSVPIFCGIDLLWLGLIAKEFYTSRLGHLFVEVNWFAAFLLYFFYLLGLTFFATYPAVTKGTLLTAVALGGLYGFFTYATYDLTNLTTLNNWPVSLALVDILWGTILGSLVALVTVYVYNTFIA